MIIFSIRKKFILFIVFICCRLLSFSQTDTAFWFAAPDISAEMNYDRPIILRITAFQQPCNIVISEPANAAFPVQNVSIPANSTQSVDLTTWINLIECGPGDVIQNKGLKIKSDNRISVYYEVNAGAPNQDFFVLKGRNSLGTHFYISSQSIISNSSAYTPPPLSSFNIVATEDNSVVTINPSNAITGHGAGSQFSITLNKGQTYAAIAQSQSGSLHLGGSEVTASKPIAITLADDLLASSCGQDLAGDQTIPVNVLGNEYIIVTGDLTSPGEQAFITATQNGTTISKNGVPVLALNAGQTGYVPLTNAAEYFQANNPIYVYQLTGSGCELSFAMLPKLNCTGSSSVSFVKTVPNDAKVLLLVKNGGQGNFLVNGAAGVITAANFSTVPGTGGVWYSAKVTLPDSTYPNNSVIKVSNTSTLFQLGYLQTTSFGSSYGFFSDYNALIAEASASNMNPCAGSTVNLYAETVASATYVWQGPGGFSSTNQNPALNNVTASQSGNYIVDVNVPGCGIYKDTVAITVLMNSSTTVSQSICEGQSFLGHTTTGIYVDHFTNFVGCDSVYTLNLTVKPKSFTTFNQSICEGQSYQGHTIAGTYVSTLIAANGCDSVYTLNLTVKPRSFTTNNQSICEGQSYQGHTTTGTYASTFVAANGCDSIYTLNLFVKPKSLSTINASVCEGQSYSGHTTAGTYTDTYVAANGCDSIRTLNLIIKPRSFSTISAAICEGQSYAGHTVAGTFTDTYIAANGCDSIRTLNLTVNPRSFTTNNQSICEGQSYQGHIATGTYVSTLVAANGCDSIYTLNLTVKPKSFTNNNQSICEGQTYQGHTTTGTYISTFVAANGCDSIYTLNLIVKPRSTSTISASICEGQTYAGHTTGGIYTDTYVAANGCDSIRTLNLTVLPRSFSNISTAICEGQSYAGHTVAGTFTDTYTAANGCDSIRTLVLSIKPRSFTNNTQSICEGQSYEGHTITGTYVSTLVAANGCDSVYTLNLTVKPRSFTNNNQSICEGQTYQGHTTTGSYVSTFVAANGCDSIYTLNLTVMPRSFSTVNAAICEGQSYAGHTVAGTFTDTYTAANGCDSIRTLNLSIKARSFTTENQSVCRGELYQGHGTAGSYVTTFIAANGCDSVHTLNLTIKPLPVVDAIPDTTICKGQTLFLATAGSATGYSWSPAVQLSDPLNSSPQFYGFPGHKYYVTGSLNGCFNKDSVTVTVRSAILLLQPPNKSFCDRQSVQLDGYNGNAVTYLWTGNNLSSHSIKDPVANPQTSTLYSVKITDNKCSYDSTFFVSVNVLPLPVLHTQKTNDVNCTDLTSHLSSSGAISYTWLPAETLNSSNIPNPIATPSATTLYYVTGTGNNGCINKDSIRVNKYIFSGNMNLPNTFSPNGDGKNDCFRALVSGELHEFSLSIYDRWGTKVFETGRVDDCWNGKFKNEDALQGVYVWYLHAKNSCGPVSLKGTVMLIR